MTQERYGRHVRRDPHTAARWIAPLALLVACLACIAAWFVFAQPHGAEPADQGPSAVALERESAVPTPVVKHPGNSPDCPDDDCIAMLVNGDLLFHPELWVNFEGPDT